MKQAAPLLARAARATRARAHHRGGGPPPWALGAQRGAQRADHPATTAPATGLTVQPADVLVMVADWAAAYSTVKRCGLCGLQVPAALAAAEAVGRTG